MDRVNIIEAKNLRKAFANEKLVVCDFSHLFEREKMYVIKGSSGCGKTTLLTMISLIQHPDSGEVLFDGKRVDTLRAKERSKVLRNRIGIIFQDSNLLNGLSVEENIVLVALCEGLMSKNEARERAHVLLEKLNISDKANSFPAELSGGERQRAGIARAIMLNPDVLICDEPISSLDKDNSDIIIRFLDEYCHREKKLVIVSCHSDQFDYAADEIISL